MARDTGRCAFLETLETGKREELLGAMTERALLGLGLEEIVARTGWFDNEIREAAQQLRALGKIKIVSPEPLTLLGKKRVYSTRCAGKSLIRVERFHKENPLSPGSCAGRFCAQNPGKARASGDVSRGA